MATENKNCRKFPWFFNHLNMLKIQASVGGSQLYCNWIIKYTILSAISIVSTTFDRSKTVDLILMLNNFIELKSDRNWY